MASELKAERLRFALDWDGKVTLPMKIRIGQLK
jgi:hypothetical protein